MNIAQLRHDLAPFENPAQGTFIMPLTQVDATWVAIRGLLTAALANQTLTITGITSFPPNPPQGQQIVYAGRGALFPWSAPGAQAQLAVTATFYVDAQGAPQLLIQAVPTMGGNPGWTLANSLNGLAATNIAPVTFESGSFLVTSTTTSNIAYPGEVSPYVNFSGVLALAGPYSGGAAVLVAPAAARAVAGHIDLTQGAMPVVSLTTAFPQPLTISGIQFGTGSMLSAFYKDFTAQGNPTPYPVSFATVSATVLIGSGTPLLLQMPLVANGATMPMALVNGPIPLTSLNELAGLDGGVDLETLIPPGVPPVRGFVLKGLSMWIGTGRGTAFRGSITFDIALETGRWAVLPNNILTVDELGADMRVDFTLNAGPRLAGTLYGHITLVDTVPLLVGISVPTLDLSINLDQGITFSVADLMQQFMKKLTGIDYRPPVDLTVVRFDFALEINTGNYQFYGEISAGWTIALGAYNGGSLVTLSLDQIALLIEYSGSKLSGNLMAGFTISGASFYFTAGTMGGENAIWTLSAGMLDGQQISVTDLLLNFLYPQGQTPGADYGIPSLMIAGIQMEMSLDPDNTPFSMAFAGNATLIWNFKPFLGTEGAALNIGASLELAGTKPLGPDNRVPVGAEWSISGIVGGTFTLFGLTISADYVFNPTNSSLTFSIFYGERGIAATITQRPAPKNPQSKETILTVTFGDLSLGEILAFLIKLASPGESRVLSSPWDVLYQINFRNLSLIVNLTTNDVEIHYQVNLNLGFARLDAVGFRYANVNGEGAVYIQLYGEFLGQPYGDDNPLTWDVMNEEAPSVPGQGSGLIDIRYVGMGQHIALSTPPEKLRTVEDVITALKASMKPVSGEGNPLNDPAAASLRYDGNSKWLFGVQALLIEGAISLAAVFYDPYLYGAVIELAGERAGALAGLRFELVYRRITADIGEFSIDLRVPDQFRNWEFGEVTITLGLIHLDIYTNGNFRVDAGFPHNQDFSGSFGVQVFPFIGQGGFYFAYLTGATSERVPRATNGEFSPVIEAGIGLAVGLGKEFSSGPLKAGLSIELVGIFEGVFAPFHPYDRAVAGGNYYWIQGVAGIVGKLYGSVDFKVIKVSVSVVARASVTFILEAHEPTVVALHLQVTAEASITIVFFTIHFSFDLTIDESITIGSHTAVPWVIGPSSDLHAPNLVMARLAPQSLTAAQPRLRQQRPQYRRPLLTRLRNAAARLPAFTFEAALRAGSKRELLLGAEALAAWTPIAVFGAGTPETARVQFVPGFTIADPSTLFPPGEGDANQVQVVLMLLAENTISPDAASAAEVKLRAISHLHAANDDDVPAFPLMAEAFFRWAAAEGAGAQGSQSISRLQLQDILDDLADPEFASATFDYSNLANFLGLSLYFEVVGYPTSGPEPSPTSGTFVPIIPELTATVTSGGVVTTQNYGAEPPVSQQYIENLAAYVAQLQTNAAANTANDPFAPPAPTVAAAADVPGQDASMAKVIFSDYFLLLTRAAVQAAADLLDAYPYTYPEAGGPSLQDLANSFDTIEVSLRLGKGQSLAHVAAATGMHPDDLAAANRGFAGAAGDPVNLVVGVTPLSIAQDNPTATLASGLQFNTTPLPYQVRAGQTLTTIAQAAPRQITGSPQSGILPAPTAVSVGTTNAGLTSLLRQGSTLTIPAFTYTGLANDTAPFVSAMFSVRNQGTSGVENLEWFAQAVATLNPSVDWSALASGATIPVPSGFQNTTPAAVEYPIHQGDTLDLIAGAFAVFYANGGVYAAAPAGTPFPVAQMQHTLASTDTFTALVTLFPGLTLDALVGANTTADILTPLATLALPAYGAQFSTGDTLAGLASLFDVSLADLVDMVKQTAPAFTGGAALTIRDVPGSTVDQLVADLHGAAQVNQVATQVSRFLMYGMRMPAPNDETFLSLTPAQVLAGDFTGSLYGLYDLTGQQFEWLTPEQASLAVAITSSGAAWVILSSSTVSDGSAPSSQLLARNPYLARRQPFSGMVLATDSVTQLDLTIDYATFSTYLPATTLTLQADAPQPMRLYEERAVHTNLQNTIHWQAAAQPTLPSGADPNNPGEPGLWPFTQQMQQLADAGGTAAYGLFTVPLDAPPGTEGTALVSYAWATMLPFAIQRVSASIPPTSTGAAPPPGSQWLSNTYLVLGSDQANSDLLYALWVYLQSNPSVKTGTRLYLLYPPNATSSNPKGLASDAVTGGVYLLKTNLSTETRPPTAALVSREAAEFDTTANYSAALSQPADFTTFLWEASVVRPGGFYLGYTVNGNGLPDSIFDPSGRATIYLVCLLGSQTSGSSGGALLPVNNCAVVGDNVDASAVQLYAEQTSAGASTTRIASVPAGNIGFTILRTPPETAFPTSPPEQMTGSLYNLTGWTVEAQAPFAASNEGQPVGPTPPDNSSYAGKWFYHAVFDAARLATADYRIPQHCPALPSSQEDPYAGVTATSNAKVAFAMHDSFGNQAIATDPLADLPIPFRYIDRVIGLSEWPGSTVTFTVQASSNSGPPQLAISLQLQASNYTPGPGLSTTAALYAASSNALRYKQIFYQLSRPQVTVSATTTLDKASLSTPLALVRARFTGFAAAAYVFSNQIAGLPAVNATPSSGQTLAQLAAVYSVTATDLLTNNQDLLASRILTGNLDIPQYDRYKHNETLTSFATRNGTNVTALLGLGDNVKAPAPAGITINVPDRAIQVQSGQTLAQMASAAGCTPGDIAGANSSVAGLLTDELNIIVRGITLVTSSSTFDSLVLECVGRGITTTAAEIAALNDRIPGIFNAGSDGTPVTYTVRNALLSSPASIESLVAAQFGGSLATFISLNSDTPGMIVENTRLQTGTSTQTAPDDETLRRWVQDILGLSMNEFASANSPAVLNSSGTIQIPALLAPTTLAAVPYAIVGGQSVDAIALLFPPVTSTTLGETNQDVGGLFVPGQQVSVGSMGPVTTDAEDSIASLLLKFPSGARPTLDQLIATIAPSTTLLQSGALLACPTPRAPQSALSLSALAARYGTDLQTFARVNASLDGFLDSSQSVTLSGVTIVIGPHGTLASLLSRAIEQGVVTDFNTMIAAISGDDILALNAAFLLSPVQMLAYADLPAAPNVDCAITPIAANVIISRPSDQVNSDFAATPGVAAVSSPIPPLAAGVPANYSAFAALFEAAWPGLFRVGVGAVDASAGSMGRHLYAVRFATAGTTGLNAISRVELSGAPSYFALPPLCNQLVSRLASVRTYQSGAADPLPPPAEDRMFQAVDVQTWANAAMEAVDLLLSPAYASGAFAVTASGGVSAIFNNIVSSKGQLASKISAQVTNVLTPASGDSASAQKALEQTLSVSLVEGFTTDAILQVPTVVAAQFDTADPLPPNCSDGGGHRLAGKSQSAVVPLDSTTTLDALAPQWHVNVDAIARLLGDTPNLLATGVTLENAGKTWTIGPHDTLRTGAETLGFPTLDAFAAVFGNQAPLFRDQVSVAVDSYSAVTVNGSTLASMSDLLDAGVGILAVSNQDVSGLLTGSIWVNGVKHDVTGETSSLAAMAQSLNIPVEVLGIAIAGQACLYSPVELFAVNWVPNYTLSPGKIDLDEQQSTLNLLLNIKQRADRRRLLINLGFQLTGLEYEVAPAPFTSGYEKSEWLQFISPLDGPPQTAATIQTDVGQLDIPIPLRAYPTPVQLVSQFAGPSTPDPKDTPIQNAKSWRYLAIFQTGEAAQDLVYLKIGINFVPAPSLRARDATTDPFNALAEFTFNYPAIQADLANVLLPPSVLASNPAKMNAAQSAVKAMDILAGQIASTWGMVAPDDPIPAGPEALIPQQSYEFRMETRIRSGANGAELMDALVLVRTTGTDSWGPNGQIPHLGYIDADGNLQPLAQPTVPPGPTPSELLYLFEQDIPAYVRRNFAIWYEALNVTVEQNARLSVRLTRNELLTPDGVTDSLFIYSTPETHFYDIAVPAIVRQESISIGSGTVGGFAAAVTTMFTDLLGSNPEAASTREKAAVRYGFRLVAPAGQSPNSPITDQDIVTLAPVFFLPLFSYSSDIPSGMQDAVNAWVAGNPPAPEQTALLSMDLTVFSTLMPDRAQPLLELKRLDYSITAT